MQNEKTASINYQSDRKINKKIFNKWLNEDIEYSINKLENGQVEYEAVLTKKNVVYYISSFISEEEYIRILENVNFY